MEVLVVGRAQRRVLQLLAMVARAVEAVAMALAVALGVVGRVQHSVARSPGGCVDSASKISGPRSTRAVGPVHRLLLKRLQSMAGHMQQSRSTCSMRRSFV